MLKGRYSYRPLIIPFLIIAWIALVAFVLQTEEFSTLEELLIWIFAGGGSMILAGKVLALFLENLAWWHNLPRWVKLVVPIALAGLFAVVAESVVVTGLLAFIPEQAQVVILLLVNWLFSQLQYKSIKLGSYGAGVKK